MSYGVLGESELVELLFFFFFSPIIHKIMGFEAVEHRGGGGIFASWVTRVASIDIDVMAGFRGEKKKKNLL